VPAKAVGTASKRQGERSAMSVLSYTGPRSQRSPRAQYASHTDRENRAAAGECASSSEGAIHAIHP